MRTIFKAVAKKLTFLFLLFALASGVLAGTPLHATNGHMMKCCSKAKSKDQSPQARSARLCCAVNCSETVPTSSTSLPNFAASAIVISDSIAARILAVVSTDRSTVAVEFPTEIVRFYQPRYIQHHSFRI